jgi:3-dehydroquinate dehydratase/shikimate dehydrogenase
LHPFARAVIVGAIMICVTIARPRHKMVAAEHRALAERGAKLVEVRLDYLERSPDLNRLLKFRPTPVIVTCRRPIDGGKWTRSEDERLTLLRSAIVGGADYVDLELDVIDKVPRYGKTQRIVSYHDFEKTPDDLAEIYARLTQQDADIIKLVTMANSPRDALRVLKLMDGAPKPTVAFCMGEFGLYSRVICGKFGAPFTYASFAKDHQAAPGQLSFDEMKSVYRYDLIHRETQLFAVLGDPIAHSLSPLLHNAALLHAGVDGVYVPIRIPAAEFDATLDELVQFGFRGFSVTIPHKEAALAKFPQCDDLVQPIGAANTIYQTDEGEWRTDNTDLAAAMESLAAALAEGESLAGKRVLMLGAGGAARAIGYGVVSQRATLVIANRTIGRAQILAEQLGCRFIDWEDRDGEPADVVINCTSVGMSPQVDETPFAADWLQESQIVFDTVYNPEQTRLLKEAREKLCRTVSGIEMFIRQAAAQFQRFTGKPAPMDVLRETLRRGLAGK